MIQNQSSATTYIIQLTDDITIDPIAVTYTSNVSGSTYVCIDMNGHTLTINDSESEYGLKFINTNRSVTIQIINGNLFDNHSGNGYGSIVCEGNATYTSSLSIESTDLTLGGSSDSASPNAAVCSNGVNVHLREGTTIANSAGDSGYLVGIHFANELRSANFYIYDDSSVMVTGPGVLSDGTNGTSMYIYCGSVTSTQSTAIIQNTGTFYLGRSTEGTSGHLDGVVYGLQTGSTTFYSYGGSISGETSAINHTEGVFTRATFISGLFSSDITSMIPGEYESIAVEGGYTLNYTGADAPAEVDGVRYSTIGNALSAVNMSGDKTPTLTFLTDINNWSPTFSHDVIVDLNGKDWTVNTSITIDGAEVELRGAGTITNTYLAVRIYGTDDPAAIGYSTLTVGKDVTFTGGGTISVQNSSHENTNYGVEIDFNGKIFGSGDTHLITILGTTTATEGNVPHITIGESAVIESKDDVGIYGAGYGIWDVYGTVTGATAIEMRAGVLNVYEGATVSGGNTFSMPTEHEEPGTTSNGGAGILISQHTTNLPIRINVYGGELSGAYALYETDIQDDTTEGVRISLIDGDFTSTSSEASATPIHSDHVIDFIRGGTYKVGNNAVSDESLEDYISTGYDLNSNGEVATAADSAIVQIVGGNTYPNFTDAIADAEDSDVLEVIATDDSVTMIENLHTGGKNLEIDLNGHVLDFGNTYRLLATNLAGSLSIYGNGTMKFSHYSPIQVYGCTLSLDDCVIDTYGDFQGSTYTTGPLMVSMFGSTDPTAENYSNLVVGPNCVFKYTSETADYGAYAVVVLDNNTNMAYGVTVDFEGQMIGYISTAFYINGTVNQIEGNVPTIRIAMPMDEEHKVNGGIYAAGYGKWTIESAYFEFGTPLSIKSGQFEIIDGIFQATGEYNDPAAANSNGSEDTGSALNITTNDDYAGNVDVVVKGGKFTSNNAYAVYEGIAVDTDNNPAASESTAAIQIIDGTFEGNPERGDVMLSEAKNKNVIEGGKFSSDVTEYCAPGLMATEDEDGNFEIVDALTPDVTVSYSPISPSEGQDITVTVTVSNIPEGTEITYTWNGDSKTVTDTTKTYTVPYGKTETQTLNVSFTAYGNPYSETWERSFFGDHTVTVTFPDASGMADQQFTVRDGETFAVLPSEITSVPDGILVTGFDYKSQPVTSDITIKAICALVSPTVSYTIDYHDGYSLVNVTYSHVLGDNVIYAMVMFDSYGVEFRPDGNTFRIVNSGTYTLQVSCVHVSDENISGIYSVDIPIEVESDPGIVNPPFIPGDDDDVYVPPTVVVDESSSDDNDAVKIAACAAAAVAAAILAVLAIALYRKD